VNLDESTTPIFGFMGILVFHRSFPLIRILQADCSPLSRSRLSAGHVSAAAYEQKRFYGGGIISADTL